MIRFELAQTILRRSEIAERLSGRDASVVDVNDSGRYIDSDGLDEIYAVMDRAMANVVGSGKYFRQPVLRVYSRGDDEIEEEEDVFVVPHEEGAVSNEDLRRGIEEQAGKWTPGDQEPPTVSVYPLKEFLEKCGG